MRFVRSLFKILGVKVFSLVILFVYRILAARILGPSDLGSVGAALNLTTIISKWGSLGIAPATQFVSSKFPVRSGLIAVYVFTASVIVGLIDWGLLIFYQNEILDWQFKADPNGRIFFTAFANMLPAIVLSMTLPILLLGSNRLKEYSITQLLPLILQSLFTGVYFYQNNTIHTIVWSQAIYWISTVLVALAFMDFRSLQFQLDRNLLSVFAKYSLKSWPQVLLQFGISRFAILIGSQNLDSKSLGYYLLASNLSEAFLVLNSAITPLVFNRISAEGPDSKLLVRSLKFSTFSLLIAFMVTIAIGKPIFILFFGATFEPSWNLFLLLLVSVLFHGIVRIYLSYIAALGKNMVVSGIQLTELLLLLTIAGYACKAFGSAGLCYSGICASLIAVILCIIYVQKTDKESPGFFSLFRIDKEDIKPITSIFRAMTNSDQK